MRDEIRRQNRENWDQRVPIHVASKFYDVDGFVAGGCALKAIDKEELGEVAGKSLLHLQCHFGLDTMSWARRGASVTGLDFSAKAVAAARSIAGRAGLEARFVESDVYDAVEALEGARFDVVYTGIGALCWLDDIARWARIVAALLVPGGTLYLREGHPMLWALADDREDGRLVIDYPYFTGPEPIAFEDGNTYTDGDATLEQPVSHSWNHGLGHIVTSLIDAGLTLEFLHEHRTSDWKALPNMVPADDHMWRLAEHEERLPLMYSLRARR